jgi:hypothetical protein
MIEIIEPQEIDVIKDFGINRRHLKIYVFTKDKSNMSSFYEELFNCIDKDWPIYFCYIDKLNYSKWKQQMFYRSDAAILDLESLVDGNDIQLLFEAGMIAGSIKKLFIKEADGYKTLVDKYIEKVLVGRLHEVLNSQDLAREFANWASDYLVESKTITSSIALRAGVR